MCVYVCMYDYYLLINWLIGFTVSVNYNTPGTQDYVSREIILTNKHEQKQVPFNIISCWMFTLQKLLLLKIIYALSLDSLHTLTCIHL